MNDELMRPTTDADIVKFWQRAADTTPSAWFAEDKNVMSMTGVRTMLREIDRLAEEVAGLEKERDAAVKAMDDNWVTHQQIIASRSQLAATQAAAKTDADIIEFWRRAADSFEREMYAHSENNCLKAEYARYDERLAAAQERIGVLEKENDGLRHPPTAIICKCCNSPAFARRGDVHCEECRDAATAQPTKETP